MRGDWRLVDSTRVVTWAVTLVVRAINSISGSFLGGDGNETLQLHDSRKRQTVLL